MRQMISSGSVTAFFLDRKNVILQLQVVCQEAVERFPECLEFRLFGSIAKGVQTGLSDVDLFVLVKQSQHSNPVERIRPYFDFFSEKLDIAVDVIVASVDEIDRLKEFLEGSILLAKRN